MNYTSLYTKTDYSLLQSMIKIDDLINFGVSKNLKCLAIADDNMSGSIEFYKKCISKKIKPIIGLNIKIDNNTILLFAKNYNGFKNLIKINTLREEDNLNYNTINSFNDLVCILPYNNKNIIDKLSFDDIYIGFNNKEQEKELTNGVYINETLYLEQSDSKYLKYLYQINNKTYDMNDNYYKLDLDFNLENNYKICDMCNIEIPFNKRLIPKYNCPDNMDSYEYLKKLCIDGLKRIFGTQVSKKYVERLKYELSVIKEMDFCDYFLIVWDYINYAKENNILVGPGRGSASSSLVSYCLNIIEIDPLKYGLLFERFLNKDRVTMPDIDVDFDGERINEVIDYCKEKYGIKNVASIVTYSSFTTKQVLKDVGKVLNISEDEISYFTRMFKSDMSLIDNYNSSDRIKNHMIKNPELKELFEISLKLENIKKHISVHASGVVISSVVIDDIMPLIKYKDDYLTGYQASYLEELGFIKMDFLSLKTLTTINNLLKNIDIDFNNIPLDDNDTLNIFKTGNTLGIFQFESNGMINFLKHFKPNSFSEIYSVIALYRPGPMQNIETYIKRKNRLEKVDYYDSSLEYILRPTYGIIVYQEQIMQIAHVMANYTLGEADILRRAMSKKKEDILLSERDKFIARSVENGYSSDLAQKIYNLILKFAEYGFPKAHAVAYSIISYKMAYIKAHYPLVFMKNMLDSVIGSANDTKDRIINAKENNIKVENPSINRSTTQYEIVDDKLLLPFIGIKDLNIMAINNIMLNRNEKPFTDIFDFIKRVDLKLVTKNAICNLIYIGAFDEFGINRKTLIENIDILLNYAELCSDLNDDTIEAPELIEYEEYSLKEIMNQEYSVLGYYLNNHPVGEYRKKYNRMITVNSIDSYMNRKIYMIAKIESLNEATIKENEKICFMKISDEYGYVDAIIFNDVYKNYSNLEVGDIIQIYGKVNRRKGKDQIIANNIKILD